MVLAFGNKDVYVGQLATNWININADKLKEIIMRHLFLTSEDQIIDLVHVIAIEVISVDFEERNYVDYTLSTGKIVRSTHETKGNAIAEKWKAFEMMKATPCL